MNDHALHLQRHLKENESECIKHNIVVQVNRVNSDQSVAFCSVEQRHAGLLRRTHSVPELIWRAEQALAPLNGMGIIPLITARDRNSNVASPMERPRNAIEPLVWLSDIWRWLGSPFARETFGVVPVVSDPFGWKQAVQLSGLK